MRVLTCTLVFKNGQSVSATASARRPNEDVPVKFSGATSWLDDPLPSTATLGFLEWYLQARSLHLHAQFRASFQGDFDPPTDVSPQAAPHSPLPTTG
jgi:hypothetical protein